MTVGINAAHKLGPAQGREGTPGAADDARCSDVVPSSDVAQSSDVSPIDPARKAIEHDGRTYRHPSHALNVIARGINTATKSRPVQGREGTVGGAHAARCIDVAPTDLARPALDLEARAWRPRHAAHVRNAVFVGINPAKKIRPEQVREATVGAAHGARYSQVVSGNGYVTCRGARGGGPTIHKHILRLGGADGQSNHAH